MAQLTDPVFSDKANHELIPKAGAYCDCMSRLVEKNHFDTSKLHKISVSAGIQIDSQPTDALEKFRSRM